MPIFEYVCSDCGHKFELLIRNDTTTAACKSCGSQNLRKLFSVFASSVSSSTPSFGGFPEGCGRCGNPEGSCGMD